MAIHYKVVSCVNPKGVSTVDYACCRAHKTGLVETDEIAAEIAHTTSVTASDVKGIIEEMIYQIKNMVANGESVKYDEFGLFTPAIQGRCFPQSAIAADDFDPLQYIENVSVNFRYDAQSKKHVREYATFRRDPSDLMS